MPEFAQLEVVEAPAGVQMVSVKDLLPVVCAHLGIAPTGKQLVIMFAPGPSSIVADSEDPETVIPSLTLCVTHVGVQ